jgi:hypothetical protein
MKRAMGGGAHRGPAPHSRQRRTIRLMQVLLVLAAAALFVFAGYSWGRVSGYDDAQSADRLDPPQRPGAFQVVVLSTLGLTALGVAFWLGGPEGVRIPTPARLEELAGRAEAAAVARAERIAAERSSEESETG